MARTYLIVIAVLVLGDFLHPCSYMKQSIVVDVAHEQTVTVVNRNNSVVVRVNNQGPPEEEESKPHQWEQKTEDAPPAEEPWKEAAVEAEAPPAEEINEEAPSETNSDSPPEEVPPTTEEQEAEEAPPAEEQWQEAKEEASVEAEAPPAEEIKEEAPSEPETNTDAAPAAEEAPPTEHASSAVQRKLPASEASLEELERAFHEERYRQLNDTAVDDMLVWLTSNTTDGTRCANFLKNFEYHRIRGKKLAETKDFPSDKKYQYIYADDREAGICHAAKAWKRWRQQHDNEAYPHVLFFSFHEDWGGMNGKYTNRVLRRHGCDWKYILEYVNHPDMKAAFTIQSHRLDHPKIHSYALGYRFEKHGQTILNIFHQLSPHDRKSKMVMFNNNIGHQKESRLACLTTLQNNLGNVTQVKNTFDKKWGLNDYYYEMHSSQFIASPHGLGEDCYRNYEAVFMGSIPIIQKTKHPDGWRRTLDDMPVAWIDEWEEVTPDWISTTYRYIYERNWERPYNWKKLTKSWWVHYIKSFVETDAAAMARL